jgi:hypothetical protein
MGGSLGDNGGGRVGCLSPLLFFPLATARLPASSGPGSALTELAIASRPGGRRRFRSNGGAACAGSGCLRPRRGDWTGWCDRV